MCPGLWEYPQQFFEGWRRQALSKKTKDLEVNFPVGTLLQDRLCPGPTLLHGKSPRASGARAPGIRRPLLADGRTPGSREFPGKTAPSSWERVEPMGSHPQKWRILCKRGDSLLTRGVLIRGEQ